MWQRCWNSWMPEGECIGSNLGCFFQYKPCGTSSETRQCQAGDRQKDCLVPHVHTAKLQHSLPRDARRAKNLQGKKRLTTAQGEKSIDSYKMPTAQLCLRRFLSYKLLATGGKYKGFIPMCLPHSHPLLCVTAGSLNWRRDAATDQLWTDPLQELSLAQP